MKNNCQNFLLLLLLTAAGSVFLSCGESSSLPGNKKLTIVADESYTLLMDTQVYMFESFYPAVKVNVRYDSENNAINALLNDSAKVALINRDIREDEKAAFNSRKIYPRTVKIAEDAIAFIVNRETQDSVFTVDRIKSILEGRDTIWRAGDASKKNNPIHVVFDNPGSANARYLNDSLLKGKDFSKNCFAVKSNPEVIRYVKEHPGALGVISVNWISDQDDTLSRRFLKEIRVAGISHTEGGKAFKPYQAYIKTKEYPFCRDVYMITRQTSSGPGMNFVNFVSGEKGQRIILKAGLIPAIAPVRLIKMN